MPDPTGLCEHPLGYALYAVCFQQAFKPPKTALIAVVTCAVAAMVQISDVLDFSKIEAGTLELEAAPFSVRQCLEEAADLVAARAADKGLHLATHTAPAIPALVTGDVSRLRQVLVRPRRCTTGQAPPVPVSASQGTKQCRLPHRARLQTGGVIHTAALKHSSRPRTSFAGIQAVLVVKIFTAFPP